MTNLHQRDLSWDVLKGMLILLVIVAHAIPDALSMAGEDYWHNDIFNSIYLFHMPLFVFVSGYFAHSIGDRDFKNFITSRMQRLLLPWIVWTCICIIIHLGFDTLPYSTDSIIGCVKNLLKTILINYTYIWYLVCIFALSCFYYPILRFKQTKEKEWLTVSVISIVILASSVIFYDKMPLRTNGLQINRMSVVFALGITYYFIRDKIRTKEACLLFMIAVVACSIGFYHNGIYFGDYNLPQKMYNGVMCTIIMFSILKPLSNRIHSTHHISNLLIWCGQNSLGLYVVHMFWRLIFKISNIDIAIDTTWGSILLFILYMLLSTFVIQLAKRTIAEKTYILGI